jgi:hypothetical protein
LDQGDSSNLRYLDACEHVYIPLDLVKNMLHVQPLALVHAALDLYAVRVPEDRL